MPRLAAAVRPRQRTEVEELLQQGMEGAVVVFVTSAVNNGRGNIEEIFDICRDEIVLYGTFFS